MLGPLWLLSVATLIVQAAQKLQSTAVSSSTRDFDASTKRYQGLLRRQENAESICHIYGIDYQDNGTYALESPTNAKFTCVSQFEGCAGGDANIILVNDQTEQEYDCTDIPTTPDGESQMSTCPIEQDHMSSGNWTVVAIGNNGDAAPFAWQRKFYLSVATPNASTQTSTESLFSPATSNMAFECR
jgi:hypothetical protein